MRQIRKVEVFTGECFCCDEAVALVKRLAGPSCEITIHRMREESSERRAKELGVKRCPSVAVDGRITADSAGGLCEYTLRAAGIGNPL
jgi:hypothetical protein